MSRTNKSKFGGLPSQESFKSSNFKPGIANNRSFGNNTIGRNGSQDNKANLPDIIEEDKQDSVDEGRSNEALNRKRPNEDRDSEDNLSINQ